MSTKNDADVQQDPLETAMGFWENNKKIIIGISAAIILIAGGWLVYKKWFKEPNELRASESMYKAEAYFAADSLDKALNGDGVNKGFLYIIKNYGGTESGNLAHYYAGVIYLKKEDYNNAVTQLKDFSTSAKQIQAIAYGCLGDAYSELGKKEEAVEKYKKAGNHFEKDELNSSEYLFRAGQLLETMNKNTEAVEVYTQLKDKFPNTPKGSQIDKFIYRLSIEKNDFSVK